MNPIPDQYTGTSKDIEETVSFTDVSVAKEFFKTARERLFDINHWHEIAAGISAEFLLIDPEGVPVNRMPEERDHFRIHLPGPGAEKKYDWVRIEELEDKTTPDEVVSYAMIRVRPCKEPGSMDDDIKHFFPDTATSTFILHRIGLYIKAAVYSRNEKPNVTETADIIDKVRNTVVALGAIFGFSELQWKSLVKGILSRD